MLSKNNLDIKPYLVRKIQDEFSLSAFAEMSGEENEQTYHRGAVHADSAQLKSCQTIRRFVDGSSPHLVSVSGLSHFDRIEILLTVAEVLNINPQGIQSNWTASFNQRMPFYILNVIAEDFCLLEETNQNERKRLLTRLARSIDVIGDQLKKYLPQSEYTITQLTYFLSHTLPQTAPFEKTTQLIQYCWNEYVTTAAKTSLTLSREGKFQESAKAFNKTLDFIIYSHATCSEYATSAPAAMAADAYDQWLHALSRIDPLLPVETLLRIALSYPEKFELTQVSWRRLSAYNRKLIRNGQLDKAENFLNYISEKLLGQDGLKRPGISSVVVTKQNVFYRFLENEYEAFSKAFENASPASEAKGSVSQETTTCPSRPASSHATANALGIQEGRP